MIRKVRPGDSSVICKISCEELGYECSESLVKLHIENLDDSREAVFVEESDGKVVGFLHVEKYATLYFEPMVNILGLAVKKEYQHTGIGRKLMNEVEQWATSLHANEVSASWRQRRRFMFAAHFCACKRFIDNGFDLLYNVRFFLLETNVSM